MPESAPPASILVLSETADRPFNSSHALAELLRLEGINDLETAPLEALSSELLDGRSLVVLGPADPAVKAVDILLAHVESGGGLICLSPGEALAGRLGLAPPFTGRMHPRIRVPFDEFPNAGLPVRGWAHHYRPGASIDAEEIASLLSPEGTPTNTPAIFQFPRGKGKIIVLAYDIAACVYLLRQGNPLLAGCRSLGFSRMRPADLFQDWQDAQTAEHPVADLHTHLFRELIHRAWPDGAVLPWLWYFPGDADTLLVLTSDDDWSTREQFETLIDACERHDARLTFYLIQGKSVMDRPWLASLLDRGFDFSIHPNLPVPSLPDWDTRLTDHVRQFRETYARPPGSSVRNHAVVWAGYLEGARIQARHGFAFDTNYFSILPHGRSYMAGAGLPARFVDLTGEVLPIFQLPSQYSDETTLGGQGFEWSLDLTPDQGIDLITGVIQKNAATQHSMLCVNAHPVSFATYSSPMWVPVLQFARDHHIPVWNADRFARFWQTRRQTRLRPIPTGQRLPAISPPETPGLSAMSPVSHPTPSAKTRTLCGRAYASIPLDS